MTRWSAPGFALLLVALVAAPAPARANPVDMFGFGARGPAMGGAQVAAASDGSASYYNPALLARLETINIGVGYQVALPTLLANGEDLDVDVSRGFALNLAAPGRIGSLPIAIGVGVFLPDERLSRVRSLAGEQPRFVYYDNRPQRLFLAANLAVKLSDRLSVGGGLSYMSRTEGSVMLVGRIGFPNAEDSDLALDMDVDLLVIRYYQGGVAFDALPWLRLGATVRTGFELTLDQTVAIRGDVGPDGAEPVVKDGFLLLRTLSRDLFQPLQATAGLDARLTSRLRLAFDVSFQRWSTFRNQASELEIELDVGDFNSLVDIPDSLPTPAARFHDVLVTRIGVEYMAYTGLDRDLALRAGYVYEPTPTPEQVGETNLIDNDKHTVSLGAGLTLRKFSEIFLQPLSLDAYVALTVLDERAHRKLSPTNKIGDYRAGGRVWQAGVASRWRF